MDLSFWQKQETGTPLFPDVLWSRPETAFTSGKLAIIGGNAHGFGAPGIAYNSALQAGVGVCRVLLPDAVKKTVKHVLPDADYAPSTPSGSYSKKALADFLDIAQWSDCVCVAGDVGRNSETAILLEEFVNKFVGMLSITQDAADYFKANPRQLLEREQTLIVISLAQLQKFFINIPLITPITYTMTALQLASALRELTLKFPAIIVVKHEDRVFVSRAGSVISQQDDREHWRVITTAKASVYWLQQPEKALESISTSLLNEIQQL